MYLFKNTGTMVIGVSSGLHTLADSEPSGNGPEQPVAESDSSDEEADKDEEQKEDGEIVSPGKKGSRRMSKIQLNHRLSSAHQFQIVASDTTVF